MSQVGNQTTDALFWGRPEDITMPRPYYVATPDKMSDLGGATGVLVAFSVGMMRVDAGCRISPSWLDDV
jgi:hypothetical protein